MDEIQSQGIDPAALPMAPPPPDGGPGAMSMPEIPQGGMPPDVMLGLGGTPQAPPSPKYPLSAANKKMLKFLEMTNVAEALKKEDLDKLGQKVNRGFDKDWESCGEWRTMMDAVLKLARLDREKKTYPWPNAANIKWPVIAQAAMQFAARAYPEIIQGRDVVKAVIVGEDPQGLKAERAKRISEFMSWQLLEDMPDWEQGTDALLHMVSIYGLIWKKTYYDEVQKKNVSMPLTPYECVVNKMIREGSKPKRITHVLYLFDNEVKERVQAGLWLDEDLGEPNSYRGDDPGEDKDKTTVGDTEGAYHRFLEQHRWDDLDGDGYEEPYIVTVHKDTSKVVRIVPAYDHETVEFDLPEGGGAPKLRRIKQIEYFTRFPFLPALDGSYLAMGFGQLMYATSEAINSLANQLLDAGTLSNLQGGYKSKDAKVSGTGPIRPGEFRSTELSSDELAKGFFPLPFKDPSAILLQLLGIMVDSMKELSVQTDSMSGNSMPANAAATSVLAVIEQGMKVYNGIHKRMYRALHDEYRKIARLNFTYLDNTSYYHIMGDQKAIAREDFSQRDLDVLPIADPTMSTMVQKLAKAQVLLPMAQDPGVNPYPIKKQFLEALQVENIDDILIPPDKLPPPPPDPILLDVQTRFQLGQMGHQLELAKLQMAQYESEAKIRKLLGEAALALAKAEVAKDGVTLDTYRHDLERITSQFDMDVQAHRANLDAIAQQHDMEMQRTAAAQNSVQAPGPGGPAPDPAGAPPVPHAPGAPSAAPAGTGPGMSQAGKLGALVGGPPQDARGALIWDMRRGGKPV